MQPTTTRWKAGRTMSATKTLLDGEEVAEVLSGTFYAPGGARQQSGAFARLGEVSDAERDEHERRAIRDRHRVHQDVDGAEVAQIQCVEQLRVGEAVEVADAFAASKRLVHGADERDRLRRE